MKIKVGYRGYTRKDGTYNMVLFDTHRHVFTNWKATFCPSCSCVEAYTSADVNRLRKDLVNMGYSEVKGSEFE